MKRCHSNFRLYESSRVAAENLSVNPRSTIYPIEIHMHAAIACACPFTQRYVRSTWHLMMMLLTPMSHACRVLSRVVYAYVC